MDCDLTPIGALTSLITSFTLQEFSMNAFNRAALNSYRWVGKQAAIEFADNHALVKMLFSGAVDAMSQAERYFALGEIAERGKAISKSQKILFGLRSTLDHGQGGELARNLDSLYDYCIRQLTAAHASNEVAKVSEAKALMVQIREAWEIMPLNRAAPVQ